MFKDEGEKEFHHNYFHMTSVAKQDSQYLFGVELKYFFSEKNTSENYMSCLHIPRFASLSYFGKNILI